MPREPTFRVSIDLGNAEMCEPLHVADVLETIAGKLRDDDKSGRVRDLNGNTVGEFGADAWPTPEDED